MKLKANINNHPIHPMIVTLPIGLWVFSFICDLIHLASGAAVWETVALFTLTGGTIGALLAAIPGIFDYMSLENDEIGNTATKHMVVNLFIVLISIPDILMRIEGLKTFNLPIFLSAIMMIFLGVAGWLGGKLVYEQGAAVIGKPEESSGRHVPGWEKPIAHEEELEHETRKSRR